MDGESQRMGRRVDGWMDRPTDQQTDRQTDQQTDRLGLDESFCGCIVTWKYNAGMAGSTRGSEDITGNGDAPVSPRPAT